MYIEVARSFTLLGMKFTFTKHSPSSSSFASDEFVVRLRCLPLPSCVTSNEPVVVDVDFSFRFSRLLNFSFVVGSFIFHVQRPSEFVHIFHRKKAF